jgi:hypothetical protein
MDHFLFSVMIWADWHAQPWVCILSLFVDSRQIIRIVRTEPVLRPGSFLPETGAWRSRPSGQDQPLVAIIAPPQPPTFVPAWIGPRYPGGHEKFRIWTRYRLYHWFPIPDGIWMQIGIRRGGRKGPNGVNSVCF